MQQERGGKSIFFKNPLINRIVKNSSIILSGNVASSALGFVSFAIMASSLGPELLAYFALAQVYARIMNDLFNVQTWESLIKFGASQDEGRLLARTIKTNVLIDVLSALFAFALAIFVIKEIGAKLGWNETLIELAYFYSFVIPLTLTTLTIGVPRLFDKFAVIAKIQFSMAVVKLISISVISYLGGDFRAFIATYVIVDVLINVCLIIYSLILLNRKRILNWGQTDIYLNREQIKFLWWTNLRTIVRIPVRQLDILIINQVMSMNAVGIYKAYKEIVGVISRLGDPINQAIYPEYAKLLGREKSTDTVSITKSVIGILSCIAILMVIVFLVGGEWLIGSLFGGEYLALISVFYLLAVLYCISFLLTPINSLFIAAGFARYSFYIVLLNNITYLTVAVLGGMYFGIYGIVLAFAVQIILNKGLKIVVLKKYATSWGTVIR